MRKTGVLVVAMFLACPTFAANVSREQKRLETCGQVFKEIMDIPDGIPKDLLNKAECVIVIPSVLKFAIGIGGDFGRGVITCRTGQHFTGHWSAHALRAEVLSYSRSRGLFAGISLEGSTLRSDGSANKKLYGRSLSAKEIVRQGKAGIPASGRELISLLDKQSPKNESDPVSLKE